MNIDLYERPRSLNGHICPRHSNRYRLVRKLMCHASLRKLSWSIVEHQGKGCSLLIAEVVYWIYPSKGSLRKSTLKPISILLPCSSLLMRQIWIRMGKVVRTSHSYSMQRLKRVCSFHTVGWCKVGKGKCTLTWTAVRIEHIPWRGT
jgi:hypothetical protein